MDAVSDPAVDEVVIKSSAQVGKTLVLKSILGYHVHQDPAPMLMVLPTLELAEAFSKDRLAPMVRDTPVLRGRIADPRARDSGNTLLHKRFPGGHITLAGANSPASLASRPIRVVLCDEVDKYPASAGTEGDPVSLARKRATTFWNRRIVLVSTPTRKGFSRIGLSYEASDQRRYLVPCPHCDHFHVLKWDGVRYGEAHPEAATMVCPECGEHYRDADKPRMLARGKWVAAKPFRGIAGFHLNELYSPWLTFGDVAKSYEAAKDHPELLKVWFNTSLGEEYEEPGEAPEWQRLYDKRERYESNKIPAAVVMLTAGVDVQGDRLELEIRGWCPGKVSYQIDYRVILGDTSNTGGDGPWSELARIISVEHWEHEAGPTMGLRFTAIDSGYRTSTVYDFCRRFPLTKVAPVKGRDELKFVVSPPRALDRRRDGKPAVRGTKLYGVGTSVVKSEIYGWLRLDLAEDGSAPPGYCHFNEDRDQQYFKELTSEQLQIKFVRGFPREVWVKTAGVRNEPLDCFVYARAAAAIAGMDRWRDKDWKVKKEIRATPGSPASPAPSRQAPPPAEERTNETPQAAPAKMAKRKRSRSGFLGSGSIWDS